jgi:hypothetical protein
LTGPRRVLYSPATILSGLFLVSLALRLPGLGAYPPSGDEALHLQPLSWADTWNFDLFANPPLFRLLVQALAHVDRSLAVTRLLSACAGALTVPLLYILARFYHSRILAFLPALLLAFHPWHIRHSQTLRSYTLLTLLLVVSLGCSLASLQAPRKKSRKVLSSIHFIAIVLACATHYLAVLYLAAECLLVFFSGSKRSALIAFGTALLTTVSIAGIGLLSGISHKLTAGASGSSALIHLFWLDTVRCLFTPGGLSLLCALVLFLFGCILQRRNFLWIPIVIPLLAISAGGLVIPVEVRYCLPVLPIALLHLAMGFRWSWSRFGPTIRWLGAIGMTLTVAGLVFPLSACYQAATNQLPAQRLHRDLAHVDYDIRPLLPSLRDQIGDHPTILLIANDHLQHRLIVELNNGHYPEDADIREKDDTFKVETTDLLLVRTADCRNPISEYNSMILMSPSVDCPAPANCIQTARHNGASLWSCQQTEVSP